MNGVRNLDALRSLSVAAFALAREAQALAAKEAAAARALADKAHEIEREPRGADARGAEVKFTIPPRAGKTLGRSLAGVAGSIGMFAIATPEVRALIEAAREHERRINLRKLDARRFYRCSRLAAVLWKAAQP